MIYSTDYKNGQSLRSVFRHLSKKPITHFGDLFDGCGIILSLLGGKATDTAQRAQKRKPPMPSPSVLHWQLLVG